MPLFSIFTIFIGSSTFPSVSIILDIWTGSSQSKDKWIPLLFKKSVLTKSSLIVFFTKGI